MQHSELDEKIIARSQHFVVLQDISPIVPGHYLVLPKQHLTSISQIPNEWWPELERIIDQVVKFLTSKYGAPFLFEHGSSPDVSGSVGGACIEHAHIHLIPKEISVIDKLHEYATNSIDNHLTSMAKLLQGINGSYLFYQDQSGRGCVVTSTKRPLPQQFIRKLVAEISGIPNWDWKKTLSSRNSSIIEVTCLSRLSSEPK